MDCSNPARATHGGWTSCYLHPAVQLHYRQLPHVVSVYISCAGSLLSCVGSAVSAIAANTFLRSCLAAGFPLFTRQMFDNLGIQWAAMLVGCYKDA